MSKDPNDLLADVDQNDLLSGSDSNDLLGSESSVNNNVTSSMFDRMGQSTLDTLLAGPFMTNKPGDVPFIATSAIDSLSGGILSSIADQPKQFGVAGLPGANVSKGANLLAQFMGKDAPLPASGLMPQPETPSGAISGTALSMIPVSGEVALARFLGRPKPPTVGRLEEILQQTESNAKFKNSLINKTQAIESRRVKSETFKALSELDLKKSLLENKDLKQAAYESVLKSRERFTPYATKLSTEFGEAYQKAAKGVKVPLDKQVQVFDGIADRLDLRNPMRKLSPEESSFVRYVDELKQAQEKTFSTVEKSKILSQSGVPIEKNIPAKISNDRDLLEVDSEIKSLLGASYGKQWGSGQRIHTETRRAFTDMFGEKGNPLNSVRARFKNRLAFKDRFFDMTRPFELSGENKVTDEAINFFSSVGKKSVVGDDLTFYKNMQKEVGDDVFDGVYSVGSQIDNFVRESDSISRNAETYLEKFTREMNAEKGRLAAETFNKKSRLESLIAEAEKKDLPRKLIKMVAKEAAYSLKRKVKPF